MTVYKVGYLRYSQDTEAKSFYVAAPTFLAAFEKAKAEVKKSYGNRVVSMAEHLLDVKVAR